MPIKLAKIVKSNSHIDYIGRIVDRLDTNEPPARDDYGFAQFVTLVPSHDERDGRQDGTVGNYSTSASASDVREVVGVIYDTQLANPEYASFGPRLSPAAELAVLSPDFLNEQGVLIGILLLGWREGARAGRVRHGVPREVIPAGADVYAMTSDEVRRFHLSGDEQLQLHYFSQVINHAGAFGVPLVEAIVEQLEATATAEERQRLCVLKKSLVWQRTFSGVRL